MSRSIIGLAKSKRRQLPAISRSQVAGPCCSRATLQNAAWPSASFAKPLRPSAAWTSSSTTPAISLRAIASRRPRMSFSISRSPRISSPSSQLAALPSPAPARKRGDRQCQLGGGAHRRRRRVFALRERERFRRPLHPRAREGIGARAHPCERGLTWCNRHADAGPHHAERAASSRRWSNSAAPDRYPRGVRRDLPLSLLGGVERLRHRSEHRSERRSCDAVTRASHGHCGLKPAAYALLGVSSLV